MRLCAQGVNVVSVRGPASAAGLLPEDMVQRTEIHHSAVIRDLFDFKQACDKVRAAVFTNILICLTRAFPRF